MPNRIIKESAFTSEKIASLSDFEFRLWIGLITQVDDAGRGDARPAIIKGRVFPLRDRVTAKDIDVSLHALAAKGCVSLYTVGGKPYFWFPSWAEHQRIRDCKPKFPAPEECDFYDSAATCGEPPQSAALIQSESEYKSESESEYKSEQDARARDGVVSSVFGAFERCGFKITSRNVDVVNSFIDDYGSEWTIKAFECAADNGKLTISYVRGILKNWEKNGAADSGKTDARNPKNPFTEMLKEADSG